jgi:hypothetical protein
MRHYVKNKPSVVGWGMKKILIFARCQLLTSITLATWEAEIREIMA